MTAERVKLVDVGTSMHMRVQSAGLVPVGRYPEYAFVGEIDNGRVVDLRVPQKAADRQLLRIGLALADVVGKRMRFERGANPNDATKPFWNLDWVDAAQASNGNGNGHGKGGAIPVAVGAQTNKPSIETAPATRASPALPAVREKRSSIYLAQTQWVLDKIVPLYAAKQITLTATDVHAMVACLFNAETR